MHFYYENKLKMFEAVVIHIKMADKYTFFKVFPNINFVDNLS